MVSTTICTPGSYIAKEAAEPACAVGCKCTSVAAASSRGALSLNNSVSTGKLWLTPYHYVHEVSRVHFGSIARESYHDLERVPIGIAEDLTDILKQPGPCPNASRAVLIYAIRSDAFAIDWPGSWGYIRLQGLVLLELGRRCDGPGSNRRTGNRPALPLVVVPNPEEHLLHWFQVGWPSRGT